MSSITPTAGAGQTAKRDLHQEITDKIIAGIEAGAGQWKMPWHAATARGMPHNATTGARYNGVNVISLLMDGVGYPTQLWASYRQWAGKGANVRKGEKGALIVYYNAVTRTVEKDGTEEQRRIPFLKFSHVFNAAQVDGYVAPTVERPALAQRLAAVEAFVATAGAHIRYGHDKAYYAPALDFIAMPDFDRFIDTAGASATENAYGTLLHELTHWTGHKDRCDREFGKRFGNDAYAAEELVADMGSAFLCGELGISPEPRADHAQYLAHWLRVLKADKKAIFTAASKASAAAEFLRGSVAIAVAA